MASGAFLAREGGEGNDAVVRRRRRRRPPRGGRHTALEERRRFRCPPSPRSDEDTAFVAPGGKGRPATGLERACLFPLVGVANGGVGRRLEYSMLSTCLLSSTQL